MPTLWPTCLLQHLAAQTPYARSLRGFRLEGSTVQPALALVSQQSLPAQQSVDAQVNEGMKIQLDTPIANAGIQQECEPLGPK